MRNTFVENYEKMSDIELITLINQGNYEPLKILIERYYPVISYFVRKYCPETSREDAVQEANVALFSAVQRFDSEKASFSTFAALCIKRSVLNTIDGKFRKKEIPDELLSSIEDEEIIDSNSPEKIFFEREDYKDLADNIKLELSAMEYKVLQLYLSGEKYASIGQTLGISEKSVSNALLRIRKKLKDK